MSAIATLVALLCVLTFTVGDVALLEYQRAGSADWWRYLTASFVHYGAQHLLTNLAVLLVLGTLAERLVSCTLLATTIALAAVGSTVLLHLALPGYQSFAGISVVNFVLLGIIAAGRPGRWSAVAIGVVVLHQAMTALDVLGPASSGIRSVWQLHVLGLAAGALTAVIGCRTRRDPLALGRRRWKAVALPPAMRR